MNGAAPFNDLEERARWLRRQVFRMVMQHREGHAPSSFSMAEILTLLYYGGVARLRRGEPDWPDRDRVLVSKGHAAHALYPILADLDYFDAAELDRFTEPGSFLGMYADNRVPGIEGISGSLGHGLGMGAGFALAARMDGRDYRTFVILGDGECYEGSIWESAMFAAHHRLDTLVAIVDRNALCILGRTEELVRLDPLADKWRSFGWAVAEVDGHDLGALRAALGRLGDTGGKPLAIVADTVKGKGIPFMEGRPEWHNRMPDEQQLALAWQALGGPEARGND